MADNIKNKSNITETNIETVRRKIMTFAGLYLLLLLLTILFMGPFVFGFISSFKDNPNEYPPTFKTEQLRIRNWVGAYKLAKQAGDKGLFGEFKPGRKIIFNVIYKATNEADIVMPEFTIPKRVRYAGGEALKDVEFAADYTKIEEVIEEKLNIDSIKEIERKREEGVTYVKYQITIVNFSDRVLSKVPFDITVGRGMTFHSADLAPNRIERRGRVQSWNNLVSGTIPYIFHQYNRVFGENYSRIDGKALFTKWIVNSFMYAIIKVITTLLFASMAGYALARLKFKGSGFLFVFMLFSMMVPGQVTFISNYIVLRDGIFGLSKLFGMNTFLNTYTGLVLQGLVGASSVFIFKQFFESLPVSYEESARIDGANTFQIFFKIMLPLAGPAMGAVTILTFQGAWNEFFGPLVIITSPADKFPLTVGLNSFQKTYAAGAFDWGPLLAGAVISAIPILILFILFQKYFVEGVSFSGMKD